MINIQIIRVLYSKSKGTCSIIRQLLNIQLQYSSAFIQLEKMQERKTLKNNNAGRGGGSGQTANAAGDQPSHAGGGVISSFLYKFEHNFKLGLFRTMYMVVKDSEITLMKFSVLLFFEFLQMIQYAFSGNLKSAWKNDGVFYYVSQFLSFTHIEPWMARVNYQAYLAIFYSCVGILTLTIMSFIYVSYQSQRTKVHIEWPQRLLRVIFIVTTTVIFLPCLELLNSMLVCVVKNEQSVHYIFSDFKCWTGIHIIHAAVAILSSVAYILISLLITLTYYSNMNNPNDASAKSDSRADIQRLIQKIIVVFIFLFLNDEDQQWFIIILYFILSALTLERYFYLRSFHNEYIQLQHNIYRAVCLWSNIAILISKILQNTSFNGAFQLFFLGCPLVVGILIFAKDHRRDELLYSLSKFKTGEEVARQVKFFLSIIGRKENGDRSAEVLLNGFIYLHEDTCPNQLCHLKIYKKNVVLQLQNIGKKPRTSASIHKHMAQVQKQDNYQLLLQHAKNMYRVGIQKFPNSPALRIQYAYFLIEKLNKKQEALNELNQASLMHPTFDEQFIIYRNKKYMEECFEEQQIMGQTNNANGDKSDKYGQANQNAVDMMTRFAFENTFRQLSQQIERCAEFHLEFWNQLQNDRPDLGKLGDCGSKINSSIEQVDQLWFELAKINANAPKAMKLYGRYQIDILQDKETGQELLQRAKEASNMKQNFLIGGSDSINDILQVSSDGTPCIFVSGDPDRMGIISQCNSGAVRVFGYQAYEMKNQKVEKLMPDLYGKNHSKILEEALAKGPENIPNKERLVFAKHKSGYVFPVWLQLKLIQSLSNEISFIALFKIDKKMMSSNVGFILVNKENKLQAMSSSCIKMMNLDINWIRKVQQQGYDIQKLAPDMEQRKDEIASSKVGLILEWNIPYFQKKKWISKASEAVGQYNNKIISKKNKSGGLTSGQNTNMNGLKKPQESNMQVNKKIYKFLCNIAPIIMGSLGEIGHYIRLDVVRGIDIQNGNGSNQKRGESKRSNNQLKSPLFQFRFDYYSGRFIREVKEKHAVNQNLLMNKNPWYLEEAGHQQALDDSNEEDNTANKPLLKKDPISSGFGESTTDEPLGTTQDQLNLQVDSPLQPGESNGQAPAHNQHFDDLFHRKKKWAKGIEIYTLRDGRVQHKDQVDEEKRMIELEEMRRRKQEEEEKNMQELTNFTNNIKSKKALKTALTNSHQSSAIRNLRLTMNIVILFLLALAISEFTVISQQFKEINENFGMIQKSYLRISEIHRVAYNIRSLILINEGRLKNYQDYQRTSAQNPDFREYLKRDIENALNSLYDLQDYISLSTIKLSEEHQKMIENKVVSLYFLEQSQQNMKVINFTLTESVLQMSSAIFTVRHLSIDRFNETQEDIFFVMYNSFNDFYQALLKSSDFLEQELYVRAREKTYLLLTLFIASICIVSLSIPILFPAVNSVNKTKERILLLFIEIPNAFITEMSTRCDQFLQSLTSDDKQDEVKSEDGAGSQKEGIDSTLGGSSESSMMSKRQISKQSKNSSNSSLNFFFQFSFAVLVIIAYFTSMFILAKTYLNNIMVITDELSLAAYNEAHFAFMQNVQREMIYNKNKKVENRNSFQVSKLILNEIYDEVQTYVASHQDNRASVNDGYLSIFNTIMNEDLCQQPQNFNMALIPQDCSSLFNNAPTHGLQSILIVYFEMLREQLTTYQKMSNALPKNQTSFPKNQTDSLLNSNTQKSLYWLQFRFLQDAFRTLIASLKTTTQIDFENLVNTKMAVFIVFMIVVLLSYLIIWTPFVSLLSKDIWRTRMMLTIVPIHIIMKIPKMQEFLNKQISGKGGMSGVGKGGSSVLGTTKDGITAGGSTSQQSS